MTIETDGIDPTIEAEGDKVHRIARGIIGALPILSGTALEILNSLIEPPLERRKREWMLEITQVVNELDKKFNLEVESLGNNEQFISVLLYATQIAIKNHQSEKIGALKNALINSAVNVDLNSDQQFLFLNLLDSFTVSHIKILESLARGFCWSPKVKNTGHDKWQELSRVLLGEFDEFKDNFDFMFQLVTDLETRKLLRTFNVEVVHHTNGGIHVTGMTEWGQLLSFEPAKYHRLNSDSIFNYVTVSTKLGVEFLNYILCDSKN